MVIPLLLASAAIAVTVPPVSTADLVEAVDISNPVASPDGRWVAFRTERPSKGDNRIHLAWYVVPIDGSAPARNLADGGEADIDSGVVVSQTPVWAPSSRAVFFRALIDGQVQIWRAGLDGDVQRITADPSNIRSLALASDGRSLRFEVGAARDDVEREEQDQSDRGVLIDGTVDVVSALSRGGWMDGKPATMRFAPGWFTRQPLLSEQPDDKKAAMLRSEDLAATPGTRPLTVRIETNEGRQQIHAIDELGVDRACSSRECPSAHIRAVVGLGNGSDVLVTTNDGYLAQTLSLWTPSTGRWRTLIRSKGMLDGGHELDDLPCATAAAVITCVASSAGEPPHLVAIDVRTGRVLPLFDPNASLRARSLPVEALTWQTTDGLEMTGQLLLPRGPRPKSGFALVLDYYSCGGFLKGGEGDELPMAPLAEAGIAALCINRPGGPMKPEPWQETTAIGAVTAIVSRLANEGIIDRSRVGMAGLSFGSEITMAVAERTPLLRAAAISSAQIDPYYYWINHIPGRDLTPTLRDFFGLGDPDTDKASWTINTPVGKVASVKVPLLMQLPESEMRQSMELYSRLAASPTPVEMFGYPNETHIKWEPRHKLAVYDRNLDWFRFWLLGKEDPDPKKAGQYARWRAFSQRPGYSVPGQSHPAP